MDITKSPHIASTKRSKLPYDRINYSSIGASTIINTKNYHNKKYLDQINK